jgi:hypothetical protein
MSSHEEYCSQIFLRSKMYLLSLVIFRLVSHFLFSLRVCRSFDSDKFQDVLCSSSKTYLTC